MNEFAIISPIAAVVLMGWFLAEKGIVPRRTFKENNAILYWLAIPALLLRLTAQADLVESGSMNLFLAIHGSYIIMPLLAWTAGKIAGEERNRLAISTLTSMRSNQLFMGIPAISIALGAEGLEAVSLYLTMSLVGYHMISIAASQIVLSGGISARSLLNSARKLATNPMVVACFLGVSFSLMGVHKFPRPLDVTLKVLGDIGTGMALLAVGAGLSFKAFPSLLRRTWRDCFIKLFIQPGVTWALLLLWPVEALMTKSVVFICAMPVAVNSLVVAQGMAMDDRYAGEVIAVTTVLSGLTLPIWIKILGI